MDNRRIQSRSSHQKKMTGRVAVGGGKQAQRDSFRHALVERLGGALHSGSNREFVRQNVRGPRRKNAERNTGVCHPVHHFVDGAVPAGR